VKVFQSCYGTGGSGDSDSERNDTKEMPDVEVFGSGILCVSEEGMKGQAKSVGIRLVTACLCNRCSELITSRFGAETETEKPYIHDLDFVLGNKRCFEFPQASFSKYRTRGESASAMEEVDQKYGTARELSRRR
jgi:hypothetical protein